MSWHSRAHFLLLALAVLIAVKLGEQGYRYVAFADERDHLRLLSAALDSAGLGVMRTQLAADSLRRSVSRMDERLQQERRVIARFERQGQDGTLPYSLFQAYQAEVGAYNRLVGERNASYERWREVVARNHEQVRRFNELADSIRRVAARMGEPYYSVPTPAEVAVRHGLVPGVRE